jgi:hypothetical protein
MLMSLATSMVVMLSCKGLKWDDVDIYICLIKFMAGQQCSLNRLWPFDKHPIPLKARLFM